jgi:predicted O-methyltransferase YrrM
MTRRTLSLTDQLYDYILSVSVKEPELLRRLRRETTTARFGIMAEALISPEQGQFMSLLVKLIGARRTLEVGVFTGCSSLWVALALPQDGQMIACDINEEWTDVACRYWREAGVEHKIDLRLAPAVETLGDLIEQGESDSFDFAFIDADKPGYDAYYELCLQLVRPGGLIALDNMLLDGFVVDEQSQHIIVESIRALNKKLYADDRVDISLLPISDGLTLVRKR